MKFALISFIAAIGLTTNAQKFYSEQAANQITNNLLENNRRQYSINSIGSNSNNQNNNRWTLNSNVISGNNDNMLRNQNQNAPSNNGIQQNRNKVSQQFSRGNNQNYQIIGLENAVIVDDNAFRNQFSQQSSNSNYLSNLKNTENKVTYIPVWFDDQIEDQQEEQQEEQTFPMSYYKYYPTQERYSSYIYPYSSSYYSPRSTYYSPWNGWQQWYRPQYNQAFYYSSYHPFARRHLSW